MKDDRMGSAQTGDKAQASASSLTSVNSDPNLALPARRATSSLVRAWFYLVWLSMLRQARMRQMVWIALGLLGFTATFVGISTATNRWDLHNRRFAFFKDGERIVNTYKDGVDYPQCLFLAVPRSPLTPRWEQSVFISAQAILDNSSFRIFAQTIILLIMVSFLLPIWSLSFATDSIGGDRESRNLIWLLTRPLPRPAVYLAKFVAVLPWTLGLNLGGFGLLCVLGGSPGRQAFPVFWPAVFWATMAFTALFMLIGTYFRRPAVVAIVYSFFLETILGNMPGFLKRASISFYARCMMYEAAEKQDIGPPNPLLYLKVDGTTALMVLITTTFLLLLLGMIVFTRTEYHEVA